MTNVDALIVQPDGTTTIQSIDPHWQSIKSIVGGWLENVGGVMGEWIAYGDEEGRLKSLDPNPMATAIIASAGGIPVPVCGTVVFVGMRHVGGEDGYTEASIPAVLREFVERMGE